MERRTNKHSRRVDDELKHEVEPMLQGAPVDARTREARSQEDVEVTGDPMFRRADLARALRPAAFPADRLELLEVALEEQAPNEVVRELTHLPEDATFDRFEVVWEQLGGKPERRDS